MSEVANCPLCGKEPEVWCRDEEWRVRITCCKHVVYSTASWNRYAAAMELAEAKAWRQELFEATRKPWNFVQVLRERKSIGSVFYILEQSEEDVKLAEKRVLEVFK